MNYYIIPGIRIKKKKKISKKIDQDGIKKIIYQVCNEYGIMVEELLSPSRKRIYAEPRSILYYILYHVKDFSSWNIAHALCRSSHASVIITSKTVENRMEVDTKYRQEVNELIGKLNLMN